MSEENKEYLQTYEADLDKKNKEALSHMKRTLDKVFGKENNQISKIDQNISLYTDTLTTFKSRVTLAMKKKYNVTILTPELEIRNSSGHTHIIKDIFVRFTLASNLCINGSMRGLRSSFTADEYHAGYSHSHLNSLCTTFEIFCTGRGPINQIITLLQYEYNAVNFEMLCLHVKAFLRWESLEGTPYMYMSRIGNNSRLYEIHLDTNATLLQLIYNSVMSTTPNEKLHELLEFKLKSKLIEVNPTEAFEKYLAEFYYNNRGKSFFRSLNYKNYQAYKKADGTYCNVISTSSANNVLESTLLEFKGKSIKLKIIDKNDNNNRTQELYSHPAITKYICGRLSKEITKSVLSGTLGC